MLEMNDEKKRHNQSIPQIVFYTLRPELPADAEPRFYLFAYSPIA